MERKLPLFKRKTLDRVVSPEHLTERLRVTNPSMWVILGAIVLVMIFAIVAAAVSPLDVKAPIRVVVADHQAQIVTPGGETLAAGMKLSIEKQEAQIASVSEDAFGRPVGAAEISLPDGTYEGTVVVGTTRLFNFLLGVE